MKIRKIKSVPFKAVMASAALVYGLLPAIDFAVFLGPIIAKDMERMERESARRNSSRGAYVETTEKKAVGSSGLVNWVVASPYEKLPEEEPVKTAAESLDRTASDLDDESWVRIRNKASEDGSVRQAAYEKDQEEYRQILLKTHWGPEAPYPKELVDWRNRKNREYDVANKIISSRDGSTNRADK